MRNRVVSLACGHEHEQRLACRSVVPLSTWRAESLGSARFGHRWAWWNPLVLASGGLKSDFIVPRAHKTWLRVVVLSDRLFFLILTACPRRPRYPLDPAVLWPSESSVSSSCASHVTSPLPASIKILYNSPLKPRPTIRYPLSSNSDLCFHHNKDSDSVHTP